MPITKKGLLVALALPLLTLLQDSRPQEPETPLVPDLDIFGRRRETGNLGTLEMMQGAWQLMSLDADSDYPPSGRGAKGFMLITGPFMAMTVQLVWDKRARNLNYSEDYQSFISEIVPQAAGEIECKTLIGASMAVNGNGLDWEPSGATRRFKVFTDGNLMTLSWGKDNRLTWGRRRPAASAEQSIFGVPNAFNKGGARDLFGRGEEKKDDR